MVQIIKNKKVIYFADPMYSGLIDNAKDEFNLLIKPVLSENGLEFVNIEYTESPPFDKLFDILFFDWGGMSIGNDLLGSFCRHIVRLAPDNPSTFYIMCSTFTTYAMQDAIEHLPKKLSNVFLNVKDFAEFYKKYEYGKID